MHAGARGRARENGGERRSAGESAGAHGAEGSLLEIARVLIVLDIRLDGRRHLLVEHVLPVNLCEPFVLLDVLRAALPSNGK